MADKMRETDLAAKLVEWLHQQHYTVYQEVGVETLGPVADVVVDVAGRGWVIETKTSLGLAVIAQAERWVRTGAPRTSVCVPAMITHGDRSRQFARRVCRHFGIGIIEISQASHNVREELPPRFFRHPPRIDPLRACCEAHKTWCKAGTAAGGHWTPYAQTMRDVREFLRKNGPATLKQIIANVETHYASRSTARSTLGSRLRDIEAGKGWVAWEMRDRKLVFWYVEQDADKG